MAHGRDPNAGCLPTARGGSGIYTASSTLPVGRWQGIANGRRFDLVIESVSGDLVKGYYDSPSEAFNHGTWDAETGMLTFVRHIDKVLGPGTSLYQLFTGYLMQYDEEIETKWRLAGSFRGTADKPFWLRERDQAGWYATLSMKD